MGARTAILMATTPPAPPALGDSTPGSNRGDTTRRVIKGLERGRILAAVDQSPPPVRAWLLFAYGAEGFATTTDLRVAVEALRAEYIEAWGDPQDPRFGPLSVFTMQDYAQRALTGQSRYSQAQLARAIGVPEGSWHKLWKPVRERLVDILSAWDARGLGPVARAWRDIRDAYDREAEAEADV